MIPFQIACESAKLLPNSTVVLLEGETHASEKTLWAAVADR
jgi:hypothetical protein